MRYAVMACVVFAGCTNPPRDPYREQIYRQRATELRNEARQINKVIIEDDEGQAILKIL